MKNTKITIATIALILTLTFAATLVALPIVSAHDPPWTLPTNSYVTAAPNPVGVGEYTTIVMWVDQNPPSATGTEGPRWGGCTLDITKPDGSKEVIGPFTLRSATASDWIQYTPDQVGAYTFVFSWPGQTLELMPGVGIRTGGIPYIGDFFEGSTSAPFTLTVQQEPITEWQEPPLPTEYWQKPIHAANREWSQLASNWLKGSWLVDNFQRWGTAPESPHILWTQPITPGLAGGINDAAWPGIPSDANDYENPWSAPIIMNGKIYYNTPNVADVATYGYYCRDIYTGEIIWYKNGTDNGLDNPFTINSGLGSRTAYSSQVYLELTQGQLYHYHSVNGQGILAYLWIISGRTWYMLDASTGNWICTLINVPSGTSVTDQDGSLLRYSYNSRTGNLLCWNVSQSIPPSSPTGTGQQQWKMRFGQTIDALNDTTWTERGTQTQFDPEVGEVTVVDEADMRPRSGYTMNLTIQAGLAGINRVLQDENRVPKMLFGSWMNSTATSGLGAQYGTAAADTFSAWAARIDEHVAPYSPYPDKTNTANTNLGFGVTLLWDKTFTVPIPGKNYSWSITGADYDTQTFQVECKQLMQLWGYSLTTGEQIWGPTPSQASMNYYGLSNNVYDGKILSTGYAGSLYAYDAKTGATLWIYNATSVGRESPYGENYPLSIAAVADGKVYLYSSEHSPTKPLWRGSYLRCIDITDGTELWKLLDFNMGLGIADGIIVTCSIYDNNIIGIGKGPSATTVKATEVSVLGSSVLIKGLVTDISPGTEKFAQAARFPNGVPAIADEDMQAWMEYLYMQQAMPTDAKGVEVTLDTIDPNGNWIHIGRATSDMSGLFSYMWTPETEGKYTIFATFEGSESYWASYAETAVGVTEAPSPAQPIEPEPTEPTEAPFITTEIAIIIAVVIIAVIGVVAFWALRKRK